MPYDPTQPANDAPLDAAVVRAQLAALKALIDGLTATSVPIGGVIAWFKDTPGVPALPANFVECNGQVLSDAASPLNGQLMPDLNTGAQRFLRGGVSSGAIGGIDSFGLAQADNSGNNPPNSFVTPDFSPGAEPFPPYVTAVFVIRVK
jgi:hypothetical protein